MSKRVIIIHGWADDPTKGWINWLVEHLNAQGYDVKAPQMPDPKRPSRKKWLAKLNEVIDNNLENTTLVGHSLGCFLLLRFLEQTNLVGKLDKLILVAGFVQPRNTEFQKYFLPKPDFNLIKQRIIEIYCIYSDNDSSISPDQTQELASSLNARLVLDKNKGHFSYQQGINKLPKLFNLITKP